MALKKKTKIGESTCLQWKSKFIDLNKRKWKPIESGSQICLIDGFMKLASFTMGSSVLARILYEKKGFSPVVLSAEKEENHPMREIYASFGITNHLNLFAFLRPRIIFSVALKAFHVWWQNPCRSEFLDMKLAKIKVGDLLYDQCIRKYKKLMIDFKVRNMFFLINFAKHLVKLLLFKEIIDKCEIRIIILSHITYLYGFLARYGVQKGADVYLKKRTLLMKYSSYKELLSTPYYVTAKEIQKMGHGYLDQATDDYLRKRLNAELTDFDVQKAYNKKKKYSQNELCRKLCLKPDLPIVFVMLSNFTDCPHGISGHLFEDHMNWFVETAKYVSGLENANWIFKNHPSNNDYGELGLAERVVDQLGIKNIRFAPFDLHNQTVFATASAVITVAGTIGIEAGCFGIRSILCGDSPYSGLCFTVKPKTREKYFSFLRNIDQVKRLDQQEIQIARRALYLLKIDLFPKSEIINSLDIDIWRNEKDFLKSTELCFENACKQLMRLREWERDPYYKRMEELVRESENSLKFNSLPLCRKI